MQPLALSIGDAALLCALNAASHAPPSALRKGSPMPPSDDTPHDPEASLLSTLTTIAGSVGEIKGTQTTLQNGIDNVQKLIAAAEMRRAEDRAENRDSFAEIGKKMDVQDHRIGILERLTLDPDPEKHLSPAKMAAVNVMLSWFESRWDGRWKLFIELGGVGVAATIIGGFIATHWPL